MGILNLVLKKKSQLMGFSIELDRDISTTLSLHFTLIKGNKLVDSQKIRRTALSLSKFAVEVDRRGQ